MAEASAAFECANYNLGATLASGQAFRWQSRADGWEGVVGERFVRLEQHQNVLNARCWSGAAPQWDWLQDYLQLQVNLDQVLEQFPRDAPMRAAVGFCQGLRLLRQPPWECLASFIIATNKRIPHIQAIIRELCDRHGRPISGPEAGPEIRAFPELTVLARLDESQLRECKMGYRAAYLSQTARLLDKGEVDLNALYACSCDEARAQLQRLPGVGRKVADCVLLFAYGFQEAFPIDVWIEKALRGLYFQGRKIPPRKMLEFCASYFSPMGGYAQQYLFHYLRMNPGVVEG